MGLFTTVTDKLEKALIEPSTVKVALKLFADVGREYSALGARLHRLKERLHVLGDELVEDARFRTASLVLDRKCAHRA